MIGESNINQFAKLNIPLSLFNYKDYNSDFVISWYNVASKIFKEINYSSAEKQRLNLALSILMLPYIAITALGIVSYKQFTKKSQENSAQKKTNQAKKLAYNILTFVVVCINMVIFTALLIPATLALVAFCALNQKLSKDLITVLKISKESSYEGQNITVSLYDKEVGTSNIKFDIKMQFPKQLNTLVNDLAKGNKWIKITSDKGGNTVLKLSVDVTLKGGLVPLHDEIKKLLKFSLKEFTVTVGKLIALKSEDAAYSKLKELLNEFRLKVVNSIDPKIISYLIEDAYKIAFIQAIKVGKERRKEKFILEDKLKETLVEQELKDQGEKLPTEKEIIIKELNKLKGDKINANNVSNQTCEILKLEYKALLYKSEYEALTEEEGLMEKTKIDIYREYFPQKIDNAVFEAKGKIKELKQKGEKRYTEIESKLKEIHETLKKENVKDDDLKQKLKGLFELNIDNDTLHGNFRRSQLDKAENLLKHIPWDAVSSLVEYINNEKNAINSGSINKRNDKNLNLVNDHRKLHEQIADYYKEATDEEINNLINKITKVATKHKLQSLYKWQKEDGLELLSEDNIKFFNSKKIIEPELFKNASLGLLKGKIEKQHEGLKNEHNEIKTNYELVQELTGKLLKNLDLELKSLSREKSNENVCKKIEENIEKLNKVKYEINGETQEEEIKKKIGIIKGDMDALIMLYKEKNSIINANIQSNKVRLSDLGDNIPIFSINKLINQFKTVDNEINVQNRLKKQIIEMHLKSSEKFLELLKQLELEQEELTISKKTEDAYKARLLSNEKIKFLIIENELVELLKKGDFDKIKALLKEAELEYCLADRCVKKPIVTIKDNVRHFCQDLLSPLIDELTTNFINNLQTDKDDSWTSYGKKKLSAAKNWIRLGANIGSYRNTNSTVDLTQQTIQEVEEIMQYFKTTYEEIGGLIGNTFSDEGETFRDVVWPKIRDNLCEIWNRSLQDIEFKVLPPTKMKDISIQNEKTNPYIVEKDSFFREHPTN